MENKYDNRLQFFSDYVPKLLSKYMGKSQWTSCMDLGCGDGALLFALNTQGYLENKDVYAVDISEIRISNVKNFNRNIICLVNDACHTEIPDDSIDFLVTTQVIEHVPNDKEMAEEMRRVMVKNGLLYLSTVFKKRYGWYFYRCNGKWTIDPTHLREYTSDNQLIDILEECGFEVLVNQKTLDGRPVLDAIFRRLPGGRFVYRKQWLKNLRWIRIPILGYYEWELVCRKL